jgi:hypothetical protein
MIFNYHKENNINLSMKEARLILGKGGGRDIVIRDGS